MLQALRIIRVAVLASVGRLATGRSRPSNTATLGVLCRTRSSCDSSCSSGDSGDSRTAYRDPGCLRDRRRSLHGGGGRCRCVWGGSGGGGGYGALASRERPKVRGPADTRRQDRVMVMRGSLDINIYIGRIDSHEGQPGNAQCLQVLDHGRINGI